MNIEITESLKEESNNFQIPAWRKEDKKQYGQEKDWSRTEYVFTAKIDGKVVGSVVGKLKAGVLHVSTIIVDESARGKGIGSLLLERVEAVGKEKGAHKVDLVTLKGCPATKFYEKKGYKLVADLPKHYHGKDYVIYSKEL